ncbi:MAG: Xaa-Pro peptidase family protein [Deltaproteobacteria bacterium]|nr:Xaa-Pro peptidase family protein [Deltaproteobacteria bacterium]
MMEQVPVTEITSRAQALQKGLAAQNLDLALVRQAADLFYYTGTLVDGFLAVAPQGSPLLLLRRPRGVVARPPWPQAFYNNLKEIPALLESAGLKPEGAVGLELDVMPTAFYQRLKEQVFPQQPIRDVAMLIRQQRMIKSSYELEKVRRAAAIMDQVHLQVPAILKPGISELELAAALEYRLRLLGHQGMVRVRNWDLEIHYGHVLSGVAGLHPAYTDTPSGGRGFSPAFPQGPSLKELAPNEPISIDLVACVDGYLVDMTRMYALGSLPEKAWEAFRAVQELHENFQQEARPEVKPGQIYHRLWDLVRARGLQDYFMGSGPDRVGFLGHGVGLELDEFPFISPRFPFALAENMVVAFEPKFFLPEIGMVGLEDTGVITPAGVQWLTRSPRDIMII